MKNIAYIRVNTSGQNTIPQLRGVAFDQAFEDSVRDKDSDRPALNAMIKFLREGDVVHVHDLSRLGRNLEELRELIDTMISKGVTVKFHKEKLTFSNSSDDVNKRLLNMLSSLCEFERELMLERQLDGKLENIIIAKAEGEYKGRKASIDNDEILALLDSGMSIRHVAAKLSLGVSTVQRAKKRGK
jgi:DNA invertase Pin-like site-specific DNA recombinase|tara:strand:+ start:127 stop:684 length:558 start_codon:yes stop_codon:yes gene_type:complete